MVIMLENKGNMSKYDIILIILKYCVSQIYLIALLPNLKHTHDYIDQIDK